MAETPWLRKVPLTPDQLADIRKEKIVFAAELLKEPPTQFTCDGCKIADICKLVFDSYNTNGDCLYEK